VTADLGLGVRPSLRADLHDVGCPPSIEEEIPMTMQVGFVGTDGVLLASDTRYTDDSGMLRLPWDATKFTINHDCGVVVSRSGKMMTAGYLADAIIAASLRNPHWFKEMGAHQIIEDAVLPRIQIGSEFCQCLVAFTRPSVRLYRFQIVMMGKSWGLEFSEISGKVFAGDYKNSAIFWADRYYRKPRVPIKNLIPLAAHLIMAAHFLNTTGIAGLEIVLCRDSEICALSTDENLKVEHRALERDRSIGEALLSESA
jgi:hypothetical protein